jgi:DNA-binding response OmpR family regulator
MTTPTSPSTPVALVAEDEPQMAAIVAFALETQGFRVQTVHNGGDALAAIEAGGLDLAILDVMLPRVDGLELCRRIRERGALPVIMLTARTSIDDVIAGLEAGADDYVAKPFHPRELALRATALLRRATPAPGTSPSSVRPITVGALRVDAARHEVLLDGAIVHVTSNEFRLLHALAIHAGEVCSWEQLLHDAWGVEVWDGGREMVKAAVYRLRQKLHDDPSEPRVIEAVRGVGYRLRTSAAVSPTTS